MHRSNYITGIDKFMAQFDFIFLFAKLQFYSWLIIFIADVIVLTVHDELCKQYIVPAKNVLPSCLSNIHSLKL